MEQNVKGGEKVYRLAGAKVYHLLSEDMDISKNKTNRIMMALKLSQANPN